MEFKYVHINSVSVSRGVDGPMELISESREERRFFIRTTFSIIVACAAAGVIGSDGKMPWLIPNDLEHFRKMTMDHTVVMGSTTFDSLNGKLLRGREKIVLSRDPEAFYAKRPEVRDRKDVRVVTFTTIEEFRKVVDQIDEVFIMGGEEIYRLFMPYTDNIYMTEIYGAFGGDRFFPAWCENFKLVEKVMQDRVPMQTPHAFTKWVRRGEKDV